MIYKTYVRRDNVKEEKYRGGNHEKAWNIRIL